MSDRFDVGTLGSVEKTPQGGFRVAARLTRTGIFKYATPSGMVAEYRPPEEVFHADSLATLPDAPLTVGHPGMVTPENYDQHSVGHVRDVKQDGETIVANLVVQGRKAIKAVEAGMREVSCGYKCRVDEAPGVTPAGEPFDRIQRDIVYNHVALLPKGRAGPDFRLRLDSAGNQSLEETRMDAKEMKVERIDGTDYEVGTDAHRAAVQRRELADKDIKSRLDSLAVVQAKLDAAGADKAKLAAEIVALKDPARLDAAVSARVQLVEGARKVLGPDERFDGVGDAEIKRRVVVKAHPTLKLDGRPEAAIDVLFELATAKAVEESTRADAATQAHGSIRQALAAGGGGEVDIMEQARLDHAERNRNAWKTKESA